MTTENKAAEIAAYRAHPGINATTLKAARTSMLHARQAYQRGDMAPTSAMELGTAVHAMLSSLAGTSPVSGVIKYDGTRRGKEWEAFAIDHADKIILPAAAHATACRMHDNARESMDGLVRMGGAGNFEKPVFWERDGVSCKALPDLMQDGQIVDIKTTTAIDPRSIEATSYRMGWHLQMGWYMDAYEATYKDGKRPAVYILAIESKPPHDVAVYKMDDDALDRGRTDARELAIRFNSCMQTNSFPGIANGQMLALALPVWAEETSTVDFTDTNAED